MYSWRWRWLKFGGGDFDVKTEGGDITRDSGGDISDNDAADDIENEGGDSCGDVDDKDIVIGVCDVVVDNVATDDDVDDDDDPYNVYAKTTEFIFMTRVCLLTSAHFLSKYYRMKAERPPSIKAKILWYNLW